MTIYQKAIKLRKYCETQSTCKKCKYYDKCKKWFYSHFTPLDVTIKDLSEVIKNEKWDIN